MSAAPQAPANGRHVNLEFPKLASLSEWPTLSEWESPKQQAERTRRCAQRRLARKDYIVCMYRISRPPPAPNPRRLRIRRKKAPAGDVVAAPDTTDLGTEAFE
ncbi:hypothetical protein DFH06DRAFT_1343932 [Mycena polygramma]|nr:hypothetical protein DFH06DRAFT_1343932 [Mycena polygramma]